MRPRSFARTIVASSLAGAIGLGTAAATAHAGDPARYQPYYSIFDRGGALIPGDDTDWVPQGLAYWPERDDLIISYYDYGGTQNSRLAVIDRITGAKQAIFELPEKGHVGGIAMTDDNLWIASTGTGVSRITEKALESTPDGGTLPVASKRDLAETSYAYFDGGNLWVGKWEPDPHQPRFAYRYPLTENDRPAAKPNLKIPVPISVQGMAVVGNKVLFSRSGGQGHDADSVLDVYPLDNTVGSPTKSIVAPNMSEGLAVGANQVHVVYESASGAYDDADYRVKTVHHAPVTSVFGAGVSLRGL
ncbi:MAG: hypothetical protein Q7T55_02750 [Solirubrobacteraceae bacterium]|nr:hypothetical protein [Solirubrobacteraceae bacterium]